MGKVCYHSMRTVTLADQIERFESCVVGQNERTGDLSCVKAQLDPHVQIVHISEVVMMPAWHSLWQLWHPRDDGKNWHVDYVIIILLRLRICSIRKSASKATASMQGPPLHSVAVTGLFCVTNIGWLDG